MRQTKGFLIYVNFVVGLQITTLHFKCRVPTSEPSGLVLAWYYFDDIYNDSDLNHVYTTQLSAANNHSECHFFSRSSISMREGTPQVQQVSIHKSII